MIPAMRQNIDYFVSRILGRSWLLPCLMLTGCQSLSSLGDKKSDEESQTVAQEDAVVTEGMRQIKMTQSQQPDVALAFLLSMSFDEAKTLSSQNLELSPTMRV